MQKPGTIFKCKITEIHLLQNNKYLEAFSFIH